MDIVTFKNSLLSFQFTPLTRFNFVLQQKQESRNWIELFQELKNYMSELSGTKKNNCTLKHHFRTNFVLNRMLFGMLIFKKADLVLPQNIISAQNLATLATFPKRLEHRKLRNYFILQEISQ